MEVSTGKYGPYYIQLILNTGRLWMTSKAAQKWICQSRSLLVIRFTTRTSKPHAHPEIFTIVDSSAGIRLFPQPCKLLVALVTRHDGIACQCHQRCSKYFNLVLNLQSIPL